MRERCLKSLQGVDSTSMRLKMEVSRLKMEVSHAGLSLKCIEGVRFGVQDQPLLWADLIPNNRGTLNSRVSGLYP